MLAGMNPKKRWAVIVLNVIFIVAPIVEVVAYGLAFIGFPIGLLIVNAALLSNVTNGWFELGMVATVFMDMFIISRSLGDKKTTSGRKISLALLAIALNLLLAWPIVSRFISSSDGSAIAAWWNRLIGGL